MSITRLYTGKDGQTHLEALDPARQDLTDQIDIRGLAGHPSPADLERFY